MTAAPALLDRPVDELSAAERIVVAGGWREFIATLTEVERERLLYRWSFWRRPSQTRPDGMGTHRKTWFKRAGRGAGKTRIGAEETRQAAERVPRLAIVGVTAADARDVMVEGESGIMAAFPPDEKPEYEPSKRRLTFKSGARGTLYSAEEPDRLRGPQHGWAWIDEPASMPLGKEAVDNLIFGLRLGRHPWFLMTGTPKPTQWLRDLADKPETVTTGGSTYDNLANLPASFISDVMGRYEGTRLGRQELHGEWLEDVEGALWTMASIDAGRISFNRADPWGSLNAWLVVRGLPLRLRDRQWRTIVAVDPPGTTAECGIVVATAPTNAVAGRDHCVILADMSTPGRPEVWGQAVVDAYRLWGASAVYGESNQGGDMVRATVHNVDPDVIFEPITAKISKSARAEPVSSLYEHEKRWVHHAQFLPLLESQMVTWVPTDTKGKSPDRLDALVHAVRVLLSVDEIPMSSTFNPARSSRRRLPTYG